MNQFEKKYLDLKGKVGNSLRLAEVYLRLILNVTGILASLMFPVSMISYLGAFMLLVLLYITYRNRDQDDSMLAVLNYLIILILHIMAFFGFLAIHLNA